MTYPPTIETEPDLVAWWRLGEPPPFPTSQSQTPNFCLDSSGNGNHLTAVNWAGYGPPYVYFDDPNEPGVPLLDVPGAGPNPDGGIHFTLCAFQWNSWYWRVVLSSGRSLDEATLIYALPGSGVSVMFWTCFVPLTNPKVLIFMNPMTPPYGYQPNLFGDWGHSFGIGSWGTKCGYNVETGSFRYFIQNTDFGYGPNIENSYKMWDGPAWEPYEWHHVLMAIRKLTYESNWQNAMFRRRIYVDGAIVAEWEGTASQVTLQTGGGDQLFLGGSWDDDLRTGFSPGGLDEFSIWNREIEPQEVRDFIRLPRVQPTGVLLDSRTAG